MQAVNGYYGEYGGQFVPEILIPVLDKLEEEYRRFLSDDAAQNELDRFLVDYAGRPTPVYHAANLSKKYGFDLYLKREDLLHTGAHKINNTLGQAILTRYMSKKRVIAETGAGQHGVATATAAALFGLQCTVYMGRVDAERQLPNVRRMKLLGAEVSVVEEGQKTLKDAVSAAFRDWVTNVDNTHYLIGSAIGPHPFPQIVSRFQSVIGMESKEYFRAKGVMPDCVVACVGGGSNAIGMFQGFIDESGVRLVGVEAGGRSLDPGQHSSSLGCGSKGIFQGCLSYVIQNRHCQIDEVHSVSAGLDYPGTGPQHSYLKDAGRVEYVSVFDGSALKAFHELTRMEGIIPALESSHALAYVLGNAGSLKGKTVLVNLSGRGDKDLDIVEREGGAQ